MIIKHAANAGTNEDQHGGPMAAFTTFVPRKIEVSPFGRILKWPSGEMPRMSSGGAVTVGIAASIPNATNPTGAGAAANVDELIINRDTRNQNRAFGFVQSGNPIGASDTTVYVGSLANNTSIGGIARATTGGSFRMHNSSRQIGEYGLIKVGDEIMAVISGQADPSNQGGKIYTVVRGCMGTAAQDHFEFDPVWSVPWPSMGVLHGGITQKWITGEFPNTAPSNGYVQVENGDLNCIGEFIPYRRLGSYSGVRALQLFEDIHENPVGRGAFGSPVQGLQTNTPVIFKPARYWDIFAPLSDSRDTVTLLRTETIRGAHLKRIYWKQLGRQGTQTVVQLRFNGKPDWSTANDNSTKNKPGGIYTFTEPDPPGHNLIGTTADTIEMRVHLTYVRDAYRTDFWKDTPVVQGLYLEYTRPVQVLSSEEITR